MIKEIIVVEGKSDVSAVKRAVEAEVLTTSGMGINEKIMETIKKASENKGIIILTDPDFPGKKIRNIIASEVKNCKHAFIPRDKATKDGDVGVENASPEQIREAIANARAEISEDRHEFGNNDLLEYGLTGNSNASKRREKLGDILGIGCCSAKQFLKRINNFGIERNELEAAVIWLDEHEEE